MEEDHAHIELFMDKVMLLRILCRRASRVWSGQHKQRGKGWVITIPAGSQNGLRWKGSHRPSHYLPTQPPEALRDHRDRMKDFAICCITCSYFCSLMLMGTQGLLLICSSA